MIVLHAGPHKTASTYLQENFARARADLARGGWIYPETGSNGQNGHHHLAHNALLYVEKDGPHRGELADLAERSRREGTNLLFSAEGFCRWGPAKLRGFLDAVGQETVDVVYVVREPFSLLYSYWAEEVKQGRTTSFPDRFMGDFASPMKSRLLNPMLDIAILMSQPGVRMHVVPFDLLAQRKIDIFAHICETVLGRPDIPLGESRRKNASYSIEMTEFLRLLTLIHGKDQPMVGSAFRLHFTAMTTRADREKMVELMLKEGAPARRTFSVPRRTVHGARLEAVLRQRLEGLWTLRPGEEPLFPAVERSLTYYNEYHLWKIDAIREAAIALERDLAASLAQTA